MFSSDALRGTTLGWDLIIGAVMVGAVVEATMLFLCSWNIDHHLLVTRCPVCPQMSPNE